MTVSSLFWARGDSSTAGNASINVVGQNGPGGIASVQIQFSSVDPSTGLDTGDISLDSAGAGVLDPDTWISVDGGITWTTFSIEFSGALSPSAQLQNVNGFNLEGERAIVIEVTGGDRLYFLPDANLSQLTIDTMKARAFSLDTEEITDQPVCFVSGTLIRCKDGEIAVEDLMIGDEVLTGNGTFSKIKWLGARTVSSHELAMRSNFLPVKIAKDALGDNTPNQDLFVSQQHRMQINDWRLEVMVGGNDALVSAKQLLNDKTITLAHNFDEVTYHHVMFDTHQVIYANGAKSESFHPGVLAMNSLDTAVHAELIDLFPELVNGAKSYGPTALPVLKSYEVKALNAA